MFGHRAIQPIIDLQEQLREQAGGKAKRVPYLEPSADSVLDFLDAVKADKPFVVFDVETTSRDVKLGEIVEIGAVKVQGGKIADRWSTLVKPANAIVGAQLHGIKDKDVSKAPAPAQAARQLLDWAGDAALVGHNVGFDIAFVEAALGDGTKIEQGRYLDTLALAREAYPDQDVFKLSELAQVLRAPDPAHASGDHRRGGHRRVPHSPGERAAGPRGHLSSRRSQTRSGCARTAGTPQLRTRRSTSPRLPHVSRRALRRCSTRRWFASWCSTRASAWMAVTSTPSDRSRSRSGSCRAHTALRCSPAARRRCCRSPRSGLRPTSSASTRSAPRSPSATSTTTTSRRTARARTSPCAVPAGVTSATARSPSAP